MLPAVHASPSDAFNAFEAELARMEQVSPHGMRVSHAFAPGLYRRSCFIPANTLLTSRVHKTEHFYFIMSGRARVWNVLTPDQVEEVEAGKCGVTHPGTRRAIATLEDTLWVTVHATEFTAADDIEDVVSSLVDPMDNPFLPGYKPEYTLMEPTLEKLLS